MEIDTKNHPAEGTALSPEEEGILKDCESVIRKGMATFITVGEALIRIRDLRLFRVSAPSFEIFCRQSFRMSQQYTNSVTACWGVVSVLGEHSEFAGRLPENEAQARPLKGMERGHLVQSWQAVLDKSGNSPVTASLVREVVRKLHPETGQTLDESHAKPVLKIRRSVKSLRRAMAGVRNPKAEQALRLVNELEALLDDL